MTDSPSTAPNDRDFVLARIDFVRSIVKRCVFPPLVMGVTMFIGWWVAMRVFAPKAESLFVLGVFATVVGGVVAFFGGVFVILIGASSTWRLSAETDTRPQVIRCLNQSFGLLFINLPVAVALLMLVSHLSPSCVVVIDNRTDEPLQNIFIDGQHHGDAPAQTWSRMNCDIDINDENFKILTELEGFVITAERNGRTERLFCSYFFPTSRIYILVTPDDVRADRYEIYL